MSDGVILDSSLLSGLIDQSIKEKYVRVINRNKYKKLKLRVNERTAKDVMEILVLFEKAYINVELWYEDTIDFTPLLQKGLVELLPEKGFDSYVSAFKPTSHRNNKVLLTLQYLRPLLQPYTYYFLKNTGWFKDMDLMLKRVDLTPLTYPIRRNIVKIIYDLIQSGKFFYPILAGDFKVFEKEYNLKGKAGMILDAWLQYCGSDRWAYEASVLGFILIPAEACWLFNQSSLLGVPIVSDRFSPSLFRRSERQRYDWLNVPACRKEAFRIFQITIKDINGYFPEIKTMEDVFRLREDKQIARFRKKILEFSKRLKEGDPKSIEEIRKEIIDANAQLKKLGPLRKLSKWTTYLSLPVGIVETIVNMPILGLVLLITGVGGQMMHDYTEIKHDWIAFGCPE